MEQKATVRFVSKEPYDAGYGPSINTKVKFDDPTLPGLDERGEKTIYVPTSSPDASIIKSLSPGDRVVVDVVKRGAKSSFVLIGKDEMADPQPASQPAQQQASAGKRSNIWRPMTPEQKSVWEEIVQEELGKYSVCYILVDGMYPEIPAEEKADIATTLFINSQRRYNPSLILEDDVDQDTALVMMVNTDDIVNSLLDSITVLIPFYADRPELEATLKSLGLSSKDITSDERSWLRLFHIAKEYADIVFDGADESVAISIVADKYELAAF